MNRDENSAAAPEQNPDAADYNKARKRRRRKKQGKRLLGLIAILLVAAAVGSLLAVYFNMDISTTFSNIASAIKTGGSFPVSVEQSKVTALLPMDGGVAVASATGVEVYNSNGVQVGAFRDRYIRPVTRTAGGKFITFDLGGTELLVGSLSKELFTYKAEEGLQAADICSSGVFAYSEIDSEYLSRLTVCNALCEEMYVWSTNECYVTDIALTSNGRQLAAAAVLPGGGALESSIRFHSFSESAEAAVALLPDEMILSMVWSSSNRLQVVTDRSVRIYDRTGSLLEAVRLKDTPQSIENSETGAIYVAVGDCRSSEGLVITAYDASLNVLGTASLDRNLLSLTFSDGRLYILEEGALLLADKNLTELSDRGVGDLFNICPAGTCYYGMTTDGLIRSKL